jgi:saccharopine dehydrogenase-like NADP-dependent oxidoreductase
MMHKVLILGGKIGSLISGLPAESGDYEVHVADVNGDVARAVVEAHAPASPRA